MENKNTSYIKMLEALELIARDGGVTFGGEVARKVLAEVADQHSAIDQAPVAWEKVVRAMNQAGCYVYSYDPLKAAKDNLMELLMYDAIYMEHVPEESKGLRYRIEGMIHVCELILGMPLSRFPLITKPTRETIEMFQKVQWDSFAATSKLNFVYHDPLKMVRDKLKALMLDEDDLLKRDVSDGVETAAAYAQGEVHGLQKALGLPLSTFPLTKK